MIQEISAGDMENRARGVSVYDGVGCMTTLPERYNRQRLGEGIGIPCDHRCCSGCGGRHHCRYCEKRKKWEKSS